MVTVIPATEKFVELDHLMVLDRLAVEHVGTLKECGVEKIIKIWRNKRQNSQHLAAESSIALRFSYTMVVPK
jgi:hypothetical protein